MNSTPIYDQLMTQQQQAENGQQPAEVEDAAVRKAEGLPWLRFWRG